MHRGGVYRTFLKIFFRTKFQAEFTANQIQGILEKDPDHVPVTGAGGAVSGKRVRAVCSARGQSFDKFSCG
jgi:hypothetical protein